MSTAAIKGYTVDEYLALERNSENKHEFYRGEIFAMAGASEFHNLITGNLVREIGGRLLEGPCRVSPGDMRVKCPTGLYCYPDVTIVCDQTQLEDDHRDTLLNPLVIFEVLSPSTEACDRSTKFEHYRTIPSLQEYVLVSQDRPLVERYRRQSDSDDWVLTAANDPGGTLELTAVDCVLSLQGIYAKVDLVPVDQAKHPSTPSRQNGVDS